MRNRLWLIGIAMAAGSAALDGQTAVDLGRQGRLRSGTTLPAACFAGQMFLRAQDGGVRLYSCSAANTWSPVGAAGLTENGDGSVSAASGFSQRQCPVSASGEPAFDASACNVFTLTLGTSAGSSVLTGAKDGQELLFVISQDDAGGKVFTWPAQFREPCAVGSQPFETTVAKVVYHGGEALTTSCTTSEPATLMSGPTRQPPATPASGLACWFDADGNTWKCKDPAGKVTSSVLTSGGPVANEFVTHIDANGVARTAPVSATQLSEGTTGTGAVARAVAPRIDGAVLTGQTATEGVSLGGAGCVSRTWTAGTGGVTANTLVAVNAGTVVSYTAGAAIYGIAKAGGTAGTAVEVCIVGTTNLRMESGATADHIVVASSTAPGSGRDSGVTAVENVAPGAKVAGKVVSGCAGAGCTAVVNLGTESSSAAGGSGATDLADLTTAGMLSGNLGIGTKAIAQQYANDPSTGTVEKRLVTLSGSNKQVRVAGTARSGVIGICVNSNGAACGQSGNAAVLIRGRGICAFDNATVEGNYVQANGIDGRCHDVGATYPTSGGTVIGQSLETGAAGDHEIRVGAESQAAAGGGGGGGSLSGTYASRPVCDAGSSGTLYFSTDSVALSRCTAAGTWEEYVGGAKRGAPPAASTFTMLNQGGATLADANGGLLFTDPATAPDALRLACRGSYPATPFTLTVGIQGSIVPLNYAWMGIALSDGAKSVAFGPGVFGELSAPGLAVGVLNFSSFSTVSAVPKFGYYTTAGITYLSVTDDGANLKFYASSNPFDPTRALFYSASRTAVMAGGPTKLCLGVNTNGTTMPVSMAVLDWRLQ